MLLYSVCREIVNRDINAFSFFKPPNRECKEFQIKGVWRVEIIFVFCSNIVLFMSQSLLLKALNY